MRCSCSVSVQLLLLFMTGWATGVLGYSIYKNIQLEASVSFGDVQVVKRMAKCKCANFRQKGVILPSSGRGNLLHLAVLGQKPKIVELVLLSGINPDLYSTTGLQAIHYAASKSNVRIIELLLEYGADPNSASDTDYGVAPLHYAAWHDQTAVIEVLLDAGADIDQPTLTKFTPLAYTLNFGRVNATRFLLEAGADPAARQGMQCMSLGELICPCRTEYSCAQFTCSTETVHVLKELMDEACGSKLLNEEISLEPEEEELSEESVAPTPLEKLKNLLEIQSDK